MATVYLRDFPENLHHRTKVRAAVERTTLKDLIIDALQNYLDNEKASAQEQIAPPPPEAPEPEKKTYEYYKPSASEMPPKGMRIVTDAMSFSIMSISQLERIRDDDPKKLDALIKVKEWIEKEISKKPSKKKRG